MGIIDNTIALRFLYLLVQKFEESAAFKLGIIDSTGNKIRSPKTSEEKDSYSLLHKLVFNVKKLLAKLPGGSSRIASLTAAWFLIKENINAKDEIPIDMLESDLQYLLKSDIVFLKEYVEVSNVISEDGEPAATVPANNTTGIALKDKKLIGKPLKRKSLETEEDCTEPKKKKTLQEFFR